MKLSSPRARAAALLLLLWRAFVPFGSAAPPEAADAGHELLNAGVADFTHGSYHAAIEKLASVLEQAPHGALAAEASLFRGFCFIELGSPAEAALELRRALERDPALRLDPAQYPPKYVGPFDSVREEILQSLPVTATPPRLLLAPAEELPPGLLAGANEHERIRATWYRRWWVWAAAGAALAAVIASQASAGGGGGGGPAQAVLTLAHDPTQGEKICVPTSEGCAANMLWPVTLTVRETAGRAVALAELHAVAYDWAGIQVADYPELTPARVFGTTALRAGGTMASLSAFKGYCFKAPMQTNGRIEAWILGTDDKGNRVASGKARFDTKELASTEPYPCPDV
ncbi:MAG: tetratricopeptide repeat protein [Candidatus Schekmanbacteria bacterium]|nr:tetratricopeptide repeat protein [Candidatus Schekmanbacteria bacterium]